MTHCARLYPLCAAALVTASACRPAPSPTVGTEAAYLRIVAAEDARPEGGPALDLLIEATREDDVVLRRAAYRALGRLEQPDLVASITSGLDDESPSVRAAAANAVAQAYHSTVGAGDEAIDRLLTELEREVDPAARGTLARSVGRLGAGSPRRAAIISAIVAATRTPGGNAPPETLLGATLGLEAIARAEPGVTLGSTAGDRLGELAVYGADRPREVEAARIRTLSISALGTSGALTAEQIEVALADGSPQVGAAAFRYARAVQDNQRAALVEQAMASESIPTRMEALRFVSSMPRTGPLCAYLMENADPEARGADALAVQIAAIDGLAEPCPEVGAQRALLSGIAMAIPPSGRGWQPAAHALSALASIDRASAAATLPDHADHMSPFVRAWAARTAGTLQNRNLLTALADDPDPNVRTAALRGLFDLDGHAVDDRLFAAMSGSDDPQLLMTAAGLSSGTDRGAEAAEAAMAAFERISAAERETWRDPRTALLTLIEEVGGDAEAERLRPYLTDYDPVVAEEAARIIGTLTGAAATAAPAPPAPLPLPSPDELRAMNGATVVLHMRDLGEIHIALLPYEATTNAYRFYRLASEGYFDGLTFHRWARSFVIQGGSPNANEYQGDGPFTRDEVGQLGHWRGTVGISTRGHDTGDGQIFVNLIDNVRLDHSYTIIGMVTDGMDVVDEVLEGSVIERAEVRASR